MIDLILISTSILSRDPPTFYTGAAHSQPHSLRIISLSRHSLTL